MRGFVFTLVHLIRRKIESNSLSCSLTIIHQHINILLKSLPLLPALIPVQENAAFVATSRGFVEDGRLGPIPTPVFALFMCVPSQECFFPLHRHAARRLRLFDNRPPVRRL